MANINKVQAHDTVYDIEDASALHISEWTAIATCATWSRLCYVSAHTGIVGSKFLLNIRATRSNVVYNDLFVITVHHNRMGTLVKLAGSNYYQTSYKLRVIVDSNGNCYVDINDVSDGATSSKTQEIRCTFIPILAGSLVSYTSFTTGESLPSEFASAAELSVEAGDLQGNLSGNATSATNDSSGNNIVDTYATKSTVNSLSATVTSLATLVESLEARVEALEATRGYTVTVTSTSGDNEVDVYINGEYKGTVSIEGDETVFTGVFTIKFINTYADACLIHFNDVYISLQSGEESDTYAITSNTDVSITNESS